jgi:hypothetical protein
MSNDTNAVATLDPGAIMEAVIAKGDLSKLTPTERAQYYARTCESLGINALTQPFEYIVLNNKLQLYAKRGAADQLRKVHGVTLVSLERTYDPETEMYEVSARMRDREGREDEDISAVHIGSLKGDARGNAMKKAVTQAKRRCTLSLCGLGFLDETEIDQIPDARRVPVSSYVPEDEPTIDIADAEYEPETEFHGTGADDEILPDDVAHDNIAEMSEVEEEYLAAILGAESKARLIVIGENMGAAGVGNDELRAAYSTRLQELSTPRAKQPQLVGATSGEAGRDKFTN